MIKQYIYTILRLIISMYVFYVRLSMNFFFLLNVGTMIVEIIIVELMTFTLTTVGPVRQPQTEVSRLTSHFRYSYQTHSKMIFTV